MGGAPVVPVVELLFESTAAFPTEFSLPLPPRVTTAVYRALRCASRSLRLHPPSIGTTESPASSGGDPEGLGDSGGGRSSARRRRVSPFAESPKERRPVRTASAPTATAPTKDHASAAGLAGALKGCGGGPLTAPKTSARASSAPGAAARLNCAAVSATLARNFVKAGRSGECSNAVPNAEDGTSGEPGAPARRRAEASARTHACKRHVSISGCDLVSPCSPLAKYLCTRRSNGEEDSAREGCQKRGRASSKESGCCIAYMVPRETGR